MASAAEMLAKIRAAKAGYSRNTSRAIKPKEGKTRYRILQRPGEFPFWHDVGVHWIKQDENAKPVAVFGSNEVTFGTESQLQALIDKVAKGAPDDETLAMVKLWRPKKSVLVNALVRSGETSEMPQVLELTPTTFEAVLSIYETFFEENETSIFDPKTGLDIVIERKGRGLDTEYVVTQTSKANPVPKAALDAYIDLEEFIRKEHFRPGEEAKAMAAITRFTGVSLTVALASSAKKAGLLTGPSGSVEDDEVLSDEELEEELKVKPAAASSKATPPKAAPKKVEPDPELEEAPAEDDYDADLTGVLDDLDEIDA